MCGFQGKGFGVWGLGVLSLGFRGLIGFEVLGLGVKIIENGYSAGHKVDFTVVWVTVRLTKFTIWVPVRVLLGLDSGSARVRRALCRFD